MFVNSAIPPQNSVNCEKAAKLSPFFEKIIDKKINKVALNLFERLIDFLCSYCYGEGESPFSILPNPH